MGFDVNVAARQLGVDPSKITASADGSTYTVTANGVTKTYKASGEGDNSVFTPEQTTSASGSGTSGSRGTQGSITVDQSIWSQNLSALSSNLQADLFMNSGLMSGMPGMADNSGGLYQIIQNLMNAINIQMPQIHFQTAGVASKHEPHIFLCHVKYLGFEFFDYTENKRCSPSHPNSLKGTREAIHLLKKELCN